jgi:hypothetical protein
MIAGLFDAVIVVKDRLEAVSGKAAGGRQAVFLR